MSKYFWAFRLSFAQQLTYRFNFLLGRARSIMVLLILYYLWTTLAQTTGGFAGYRTEELMTYIFGVMVLRAIIFGTQSRRMAQDINDGGFSAYIVKPVNHFLFFYFRELAERGVLFISTCVEIVIIGAILRVPLLIQLDAATIIFFLVALFLAHLLYYMLTYSVNLLAFWSREVMGPRFLFDWLLEFASGAYFPLTIAGASFFALSKALPFMYLIFAPLMIYLGRFAPREAITIIALQILWVIIIGLVAQTLWKKGLRKYSGEGI